MADHRVFTDDEQHAYWCSLRGKPYSEVLSCCRGDKGELEFAWDKLREARDMFARGDYDSNEQQRERMRRWIAGVDPMGKCDGR